MATQGNVYIFNTWSDKISSLNINGVTSDVASGAIPGNSAASTNKYTPGANPTPYPRFNNRIDGSPTFFSSMNFATPDNTISFFTETGANKNTVVAIPGASQRVDITDDLIIYITQNFAIVMDNNGFVFGNYAIH